MSPETQCVQPTDRPTDRGHCVTHPGGGLRFYVLSSDRQPTRRQNVETDSSGCDLGGLGWVSMESFWVDFGLTLRWPFCGFECHF